MVNMGTAEKGHPMTKEERCENCRWYFAPELECRRRAPIFNDACGSIFPQDVKPYDWCGEHLKQEIRNVY